MNVYELIPKLNWKQSEELQLLAIKELSIVTQYEDLLLLARHSELNNKMGWHNCAIVLKNIGYPAIGPVLHDIVNDWTMDMNWPGYLTIIELLRTVPTVELVKVVTFVLSKVITYMSTDDTWLYGLYYLIGEIGIEKEMNKDLYKKLKNIMNSY